jgi:hypothetical protein
MKLNAVRTYKIQIYGQVKEEDIHPTSPLQFMIDRVEETNTIIKLQTDQSGIIGLIRHLHALGLVLVSMSCSLENLPEN